MSDDSVENVSSGANPGLEVSVDEVEEGAPTWVTTFADLMSLLLTFFVLLYSMSELKVENFFIAAESLREAMGSTAETPPDSIIGLMMESADPETVIEPLSAESNDGSGDDDQVERVAAEYLALLEGQLRTSVEEAGLDDSQIEIIRDDDGLYLRIRNAALFESAQVQVRPQAEALLVTLSSITSEIVIPTIVAGHADSRPISTPAFASNWELSAARAAGVARLMYENGHPASRLEVESYGEHRPLASNESAEGRAENRRVELFFSREYVERLARQLQEEGIPLTLENMIVRSNGDPVSDEG